MSRFQTRFPWKVFTRLILIQALSVLLALGVSGLVARYFFQDEFFSITFTAIVLACFAVWSGLIFIFPISRELQIKTENLRTEREELATLMGAISDAILAVDPEGVPLFFNSQFALLFGNEDRLREKTVRLWEIFHEPEILGAFRHALETGKMGIVRAIPVDQTQEGRHFFSISVSPLRRDNGMQYGAVGVFHNVSELKAAEQIRIDFVANVSHELRTPLTSIKGYTDTLIQDVKDEKPIDPEFLSVIARNTERLMNLINDLLDLSDLESTHFTLQKTTVDTSEVTSRVIHQLKERLTGKNHQISVSAQVSTVLADPRRLEQVLVNLLENAIKYTPAGGQILVSWELAPQTTDRDSDVLLKIKDNGPGIPKEHQARLFERFYRVDKARSREQGGTGLGLAIVKHIMQRHEGLVWVESMPPHGATFICQFPP